MGERHDMKNETIGMKVLQARKMRNYSQEKLGEKAGISQQHLSRIENDDICPSMDTLLNIAAALKVSVNTLTDEEMLVVEEKCIFEMVRKLELLSRDSKMKVSGYINCLYQDEMKKFKLKRSKQT